VVGVKVRKTTGAGPLGRVTLGLGRKCQYTKVMKRERRMRLMGDAIDILPDPNKCQRARKEA